MTSAPDSARFCEMCGGPLSPAARFCGGCGRPVRGTDDPDAGDFPPSEPAAAPAPGKEEELYDMRPLVLQTFPELLLALITVGIAAIVLWLRRIQVRYHVTNQRIEVVAGLFNLERRTIELFRVQDLEIQEPLFLRMRSAGNIVVRSMDPEEPEIVLIAVPDVRPVFEEIRTASLNERQRNRVRQLEGL